MFLLGTMSTLQIILSVFGLMALMFLVTGFVFWINKQFAGRDKQKIIHWLASQGHQVQSVEWVLYPTGGRFWFQRCVTFEAKFTDAASRHHHAFIAVPTWGSPALIEDNISAA
jgi:hypothetical protein